MDERSRYWFPAKRYGWGWSAPQTWQGWVVFVVWFAAASGGIWALRLRASLVERIVFVMVMIGALTAICYWKGEPPRWRWGR